MTPAAAQPLPPWAVWSDETAERPWTVGIEEQVLLLDAERWTLVNRAMDVRRRLGRGGDGRVSAELHACVLHLTTPPRRTAACAARELERTRRDVAEALDELGGLRAAASGTHPTALWRDVAISSGARHHFVHASLRELARREPGCALSVHVAMPDPDAAIRAYRGLRDDLPVLLALGANSPFWEGRDTGMASARTLIQAALPRVGLARDFGTYRSYVDAVERLLRCGAVPDPSFLWWDVRLRPSLGTVEVRVADAQSRTPDVAALAALVQCRARLHADRPAPDDALDPELLDESRFLAARDGMGARLVDRRTGRLRSAQSQLAGMLAECAAVAEELGCGEQLDAAARLAGDAGHVRQRRIAAARGIEAVLPALSAEFRTAAAVAV